MIPEDGDTGRVTTPRKASGHESGLKAPDQITAPVGDLMNLRLPVREPFIVSTLQRSKVISRFQFVGEGGNGAAAAGFGVHFL